MNGVLRMAMSCVLLSFVREYVLDISMLVNNAVLMNVLMKSLKVCGVRW